MEKIKAWRASSYQEGCQKACKIRKQHCCLGSRFSCCHANHQGRLDGFGCCLPTSWSPSATVENRECQGTAQRFYSHSFHVWPRVSLSAFTSLQINFPSGLTSHSPTLIRDVCGRLLVVRSCLTSQMVTLERQVSAVCAELSSRWDTTQNEIKQNRRGNHTFSVFGHDRQNKQVGSFLLVVCPLGLCRSRQQPAGIGGIKDCTKSIFSQGAYYADWRECCSASNMPAPVNVLQGRSVMIFSPSTFL